MARHLALVTGAVVLMLVVGIVAGCVIVAAIEHYRWRKRVKHRTGSMTDAQVMPFRPTVPRNKHRQPPQPGK